MLKTAGNKQLCDSHVCCQVKKVTANICKSLIISVYCIV